MKTEVAHSNSIPFLRSRFSVMSHKIRKFWQIIHHHHGETDGR
jgi:hypothetical protein